VVRSGTIQEQTRSDNNNRASALELTMSTIIKLLYLYQLPQVFYESLNILFLPLGAFCDLGLFEVICS